MNRSFPSRHDPVSPTRRASSGLLTNDATQGKVFLQDGLELVAAAASPRAIGERLGEGDDLVRFPAEECADP
jgi:hypothetical protein